MESQPRQKYGTVTAITMCLTWIITVPVQQISNKLLTIL